MPKKETTTQKSKWYKSALLPWVIILVVTVAAAGFIAGWHTNQSLEQSINAKTSAAVAEAKEAQSLKASQ